MTIIQKSIPTKKTTTTLSQFGWIPFSRISGASIPISVVLGMSFRDVTHHQIDSSLLTAEVHQAMKWPWSWSAVVGGVMGLMGRWEDGKLLEQWELRKSP